MSTKNDGGPAFPYQTNYSEGVSEIYHGMTLRDWFAGQALAAIATDHGDPCDGYRKAVSARAYALADAMLAARTKVEAGVMSTSKHTPGPWKRGDCDSWIIWATGFRSTDWIEGEPGPEAVHVANLNVPAWTMPGPDPAVREAWLAEADATASLIAAAPDMLEALREAEEALDNYADADQPPGSTPIPNNAMRAQIIVRAAIAKAEATP